MFNKESVLEILLDKAKAPECGKHLRSLKDIKELKLTTNPSFKKHANMGDGYDDLQSAEFICPVLGVEMNGKFKFCFIWTCGCVMSERSLKEIKTATCHKVTLNYIYFSEFISSLYFCTVSKALHK